MSRWKRRTRSSSGRPKERRYGGQPSASSLHKEMNSKRRSVKASTPLWFVVVDKLSNPESWSEYYPAVKVEVKSGRTFHSMCLVPVKPRSMVFLLWRGPNGDGDWQKPIPWMRSARVDGVLSWVGTGRRLPILEECSHAQLQLQPQCT